MESLVAWVEVTQKRRVRVLKLDMDRHVEVAQRLRIRSVPSLVLVQEGRVVGRLEGRSTGRQIDELISAHATG
jgi:thioredoxin-like negative regulator of GroEL